MYRIYLLLTHLVLPFVVLRFILMSIDRREYRQGWRQRFGFTLSRAHGNKLIWIHAVSVGEVYAARPLVEFLQENYPEFEILITTVTPTGADIVNNNFKGRVAHSYLPYDIPLFINRFMASAKPAALLVMETEIWPSLYHACHRMKIPMALINARLSSRSLRGYKITRGLWKTTLGYPEAIAVQSRIDAQRFAELGVDKDRLIVTGNLKFDVKIPGSFIEEGQDIKRRIGMRPVFIAASTHPGEEQYIIEAMVQIRASEPDCLLIIAPRHPVNAPQIRKLCETNSFRTLSYSDNQADLRQVDVFILDILGKLPAYYAAADIAFVGGSLVPVGGHNMLEPAALGLPLLTGRYRFNIGEISGLLFRANALLEVNSARELAEAVISLLEDPVLRDNMGASARRVVEENQGNINKLAGLLSRLIRGQGESVPGKDPDGS